MGDSMNVSIADISSLLEYTNVSVEFTKDGVIFSRQFSDPVCKFNKAIMYEELEEMDNPFSAILESWLYESHYRFDKYRNKYRKELNNELYT